MFQNYFKQILQTRSRFASDVLRAQKSKALCGFSPKKNLDWIYMRWFHAMHCSVANRCYIRTNKRMQTWAIVSNRKNTHHRLHVGNTAQHSTSVHNWKKVAKRQSKRKLKIRLNLFPCRAKTEGNMGVEDKHCMIYGNTFHGTVAPAFKSQKGWEIWGKWLMGGQRHLLRHPWHPPGTPQMSAVAGGMFHPVWPAQSETGSRHENCRLCPANKTHFPLSWAKKQFWHNLAALPSLLFYL